MKDVESYVAIVLLSLFFGALLVLSPTCALAETASGATDGPNHGGACRCDAEGTPGDMDRLIMAALEAESVAFGLLASAQNDRKALLKIARCFSRVVRQAVRLHSGVQRLFVSAAVSKGHAHARSKALGLEIAVRAKLDRATKAVDRARVARSITNNSALVFGALKSRLLFDLGGFGFRDTVYTCGDQRQCVGTCPGNWGCRFICKNLDCTETICFCGKPLPKSAAAPPTS